jgi:hypothetical protein
MFTTPMIRAIQGRRFSVTMTPEGWAVREEQDDRIVRAVTYTDWHRVERALLAFERGHTGPETGLDRETDAPN